MQPLTPEQIDSYLERLCPYLDSLREALRSDRELQEFAKTPLILSIMTLVYRRVPIEELQSLGSTEERRRHLFTTYVDLMFERTTRIDPKLYPKENTIRWLSWLARKVPEQGQTIFLIERMQPSLLETKAQKLLYSILVYDGLMLPLWLVIMLSGLVTGLKVGLVYGLGAGLEVMQMALVFGLALLLYGLFCWLFCSLFARLLGEHTVPIGHVDLYEIKPLKWSWKKGFQELKRNCLVYLVLVLIVALVAGWLEGVGLGLFSLGAGLVIWLKDGLKAGLVSTSNIETNSTYNQGININRSAKTGLGFGLVIGLTVALIFGLRFGLFYGVGAGVFGMWISLASCGGAAVIQHLALRFVLSRKGLLPWNLVSFLDYATERIFLRKVGGGYVFVHRMLMDYFASLEPGPDGW